MGWKVTLWLLTFYKHAQRDIQVLANQDLPYNLLINVPSCIMTGQPTHPLTYPPPEIGRPYDPEPINPLAFLIKAGDWLTLFPEGRRLVDGWLIS